MSRVFAFRYQGPSEGFVVTITEPTRQGGIVSIYYLGTLIGALIAGILGDRCVFPALTVLRSRSRSAAVPGSDVSRR